MANEEQAATAWLAESAARLAAVSPPAGTTETLLSRSADLRPALSFLLESEIAKIREIDTLIADLQAIPGARATTDGETEPMGVVIALLQAHKDSINETARGRGGQLAKLVTSQNLNLNQESPKRKAYRLFSPKYPREYADE